MSRCGRTSCPPVFVDGPGCFSVSRSSVQSDWGPLQPIYEREPVLLVLLLQCLQCPVDALWVVGIGDDAVGTLSRPQVPCPPEQLQQDVLLHVGEDVAAGLLAARCVKHLPGHGRTHLPLERVLPGGQSGGGAGGHGGG